MRPASGIGPSAWPRPPEMEPVAGRRRRDVRTRRSSADAPLLPVPAFFDVVALRRDTLEDAFYMSVAVPHRIARRGTRGQVIDVEGGGGRPVAVIVEMFVPYRFVVRVGIDSIEIVRRSGWQNQQSQ